MKWLVILTLAACAGTGTRPQAARPPSGPVDGALVEVGPVAEADAGITVDILLPPEADIPDALATARREVGSSGIQVVEHAPEHPGSVAQVAVELLGFDAEGWSGKIPGYVESYIDQADVPRVLRTVGVLRIKLAAPKAAALDAVRKILVTSRAIALEHRAWIFERYRARLHTPDTLADDIPDPKDIESVIRVMGVVSTKGKPSHIRTIGFSNLGIPELYVPDIIDPADLQDARMAVFAAAQTYLQRGGVTRPGRIDVDLEKLFPEIDLPEGTGKFEWEARWLRGPIRNRMVIELTVPGKPRDTRSFAEALHRFTPPSQ